MKSVFLTRSVIDVQVVSRASETSITVIILQYYKIVTAVQICSLEYARSIDDTMERWLNIDTISRFLNVK